MYSPQHVVTFRKWLDLGGAPRHLASFSDAELTALCEDVNCKAAVQAERERRATPPPAPTPPVVVRHAQSYDEAADSFHDLAAYFGSVAAGTVPTREDVPARVRAAIKTWLGTTGTDRRLTVVAQTVVAMGSAFKARLKTLEQEKASACQLARELKTRVEKLEAALGLKP